MSLNSSLLFDAVSMHCANVTARPHMSMAVTAVRSVLLLPVSTLVLLLAQQQWRRQHRSFGSTSHCDFFTYNLALMELVWTASNLFSYRDLASSQRTGMSAVATYGSTFIFCGQVFFHLLTCVDRYLAVVQPVAYLRLRSGRGLQIRSSSVVCVWLLSFSLSFVPLLPLPPDCPFVMAFCLLGFSIVSISFCSLSVLRALLRPRPGRPAGFDRSKQRAFYTIAAIMAVLCVWILGFLVLFALESSARLLGPSAACLLVPSAGWFSLPSSLLLPALYLHRAGKLPPCRRRCCCCHQ